MNVSEALRIFELTKDDHTAAKIDSTYIQIMSKLLDKPITDQLRLDQAYQVLKETIPKPRQIDHVVLPSIYGKPQVPISIITQPPSLPPPYHPPPPPRVIPINCHVNQPQCKRFIRYF